MVTGLRLAMAKGSEEQYHPEEWAEQRMFSYKLVFLTGRSCRYASALLHHTDTRSNLPNSTMGSLCKTRLGMSPHNAVQ